MIENATEIEKRDTRLRRHQQYGQFEFPLTTNHSTTRNYEAQAALISWKIFVFPSLFYFLPSLKVTRFSGQKLSFRLAMRFPCAPFRADFVFIENNLTSCEWEEVPRQTRWEPASDEQRRNPFVKSQSLEETLVSLCYYSSHLSRYSVAFHS